MAVGDFHLFSLLVYSASWGFLLSFCHCDLLLSFHCPAYVEHLVVMISVFSLIGTAF